MDSMVFFGLEGVTASWVPFLWGWSKHVLADVHKKTLTSSKKQPSCWTNLLQSILQNDFLCFFVGHWKRAFPVRWVMFTHRKWPLCQFFSYIPPVQKRLLNQQSPKSHRKKSLHETVDGSETQQSSWDCYPVILVWRLGSPGMMHLPTKWGAVQNPRILKITG